MLSFVIFVYFSDVVVPSWCLTMCSIDVILCKSLIYPSIIGILNYESQTPTIFGHKYPSVFPNPQVCGQVSLLALYNCPEHIASLFSIAEQGKPKVFIAQHAKLTIQPVAQHRVGKSVTLSWSTIKSPRRCSNPTRSFSLH